MERTWENFVRLVEAIEEKFQVSQEAVNGIIEIPESERDLMMARGFDLLVEILGCPDR